jgi:hypothetical protein
MLPDAGALTSSAPTAAPPPVPPKPENIVVSHNPPEQSTRESRNLEADLASAFDAAGLTASQRQVLIAALNASSSADPAVASSPVSPPTDVQMSTALLPLSSTTSEATPEDLPDIANILGVISRARLSTRERHAMVATLNNLLMPDQATRADLTRVDTVTSPPPYAEDELWH